MTAVFFRTSTSLSLMCCIMYNACIDFTNGERTVRKIDLDKVCYKTCDVLVTYSSLFYTSCGWWGWSRCARYKHGYKAKPSSCSYYCPVNGGWSDYKSLSSWSNCDKSCGTGTKTRVRTRSCDNPAPKHNGKTCPGSASNTESVSCKLRECPIDGQWTSYNTSSDWGACSVSCGEGTTTRVLSRSCTNPSPQYGGKDCSGGYTKTETKPCNDRQCPVDGGWAKFEAVGDWGACSTTCGDGLQTRTLSRTCINPKPKYGGKPCLGSAIKTETTTCLLKYFPVTDVRIHLQPEYQYGTLNWINCTANAMDGSTAALSLEVCQNGTTFIPIENIATSRPSEDVSMTKNENCSVHKMLSHSLVFNKQMNVSFRCRVDDDYYKVSLTSTCIMPNITPASVQVILEPENQTALLGSTAEMFCHANVSIFEWKVIHLDFRNASSYRRLISVYYNETKQGLENMINATLISKDGIVVISYVFNISDDKMVCFLDGEYSCDLEFLDDAIQKTNVNGSLIVSARPEVTDFMVQTYYYSASNHNLSCTAIFDGNADISLNIQLCSENSFKLITEDSAFELNASSDQEITGKCTRQQSVVYNFNFTQASNGTLLRCLATDHNLNISASTECLSLVLKPPVFAEMIPKVLYVRIDSTTELMCSIYYRGYAWSSINILQQNTTGSVLLLNVSSDGKVESKNARINGSLSRNDDYINVTVSFDVSPGSGVCELNQTYSCDIQLMDSSIGTTAANSTLVLEIPVTDVRMHLQPEYQYGTLNWINCTANAMNGSTAALTLEVCQNKTTFIPIEKIYNSMPFEDVSQTKNENCSVHKMLSHSFVFNKQMNVSYRCRVDDDHYKASLMSSCVLLNILQVLVHIFLEPKQQIGFSNSTSEVICYANISDYEWRAVHLSYTNVSSSRRIITVFPNYTNPLVENDVTATIINTEKIVNISFILLIKEVPILCDIDLKLACIVEFMDDFIETTNDIGNILITAPTANLIVETMPDGYVYSGNIDETINCSAIINPNTTVLSLVGKRSQLQSEYFFAERKNLQTFVDSENKTDCNPTIRVAFFKLGYFLKHYNWVGCFANDTKSGESSVTEFMYVSVFPGIQ